MNDRQLATATADFTEDEVRRLGFLRWLVEHGRLAADVGAGDVRAPRLELRDPVSRDGA